MNREIKFRAWDHSSESWAEDDFDTCQDDDAICKHPAHVVMNTMYHKNNGLQYTFQMFTGLYDKEGREIYEGDIVSFLDENWQVVYFEQYAAFMLQKGNDLANITTQEEVIGNIFQHPELLSPENKTLINQ